MSYVGIERLVPPRYRIHENIISYDKKFSSLPTRLSNGTFIWLKTYFVRTDNGTHIGKTEKGYNIPVPHRYVTKLTPEEASFRKLADMI